MDFDEKVEQLQAEIAELDRKTYFSSDKTKYIFIGGIFSPFLLAGLLCLTKFGFVKTDGELDRKKVVKWTILLTGILWLILFTIVKMGLV